jgi:hypothetical protein
VRGPRRARAKDGEPGCSSEQRESRRLHAGVEFAVVSNSPRALGSFDIAAITISIETGIMVLPI